MAAHALARRYLRKRVRRAGRALHVARRYLRKRSRRLFRDVVLLLDQNAPPFEHWRRRRRMAKAEVVVLSHPKSGRTWLRFLISQYVARKQGVPFDPRLYTLGVPVAFSHARHMYHPRRPFRRALATAAERRVVVLVRDPRDVAVSWFHHNRHRERTVDCDLPEFVDSPVWGIERQSAYVLDLLDFGGRHPDSLLMTYEDLRRSTEEEMGRFLEFVLREPIDGEALREAVRASDLEEMRKAELAATSSANGAEERGDAPMLGHRSWDGNPDALKVRRGAVGGFRQELDPAKQAEISTRPATRRLLGRLEALYARTERVEKHEALTGSPGAGAEPKPAPG